MILLNQPRPRDKKMSFISQEEKKVVASRINPILKKYGLKGTFSVRHNSVLVLTIRSGSIDFIKNHNDMIKNRYDQGGYEVDGSIQVNEYWYTEHFTGVALEALKEIIPAMYTDDYHDNSDISSDYFDVSYYVNVNIGTWDRPYKVI
jgi:hypothetical protein